MPERTKPTHIVHITIPINEDARKAVDDFDGVQQALQLAIAVSMARYRGVVCDEIQVNLSDA